MNQYREFYRRHLPHWQPRGAVFFVTFRLKNSLPISKIELLLKEKKKRNSERAAENHPFSRWDSLLDRVDAGPRWLAQPAVAQVVQEALHFRDKREYDLYAFCIMPNHVHMVFEPLEQGDKSIMPLNRIMQSLKRHTARQANLLLGREGAFWQDESYDHAIRNEGEFERIVRYVLNNPVKAGLVSDWESWPWAFYKLGV